MKRLNPHLILALSAAVTLAWGCTRHTDHDHEHAESEAHAEEADGHHHDDGEIVIHPEDAEQYGIEVEAAVRAPFAAVVKTSGEIMPSAAGRKSVTATKSGVITLARGITEGATVRQGAAVATVSSRNVSGGDADRAALANLEAAKRELDRCEKLLASGLVTRKEYNDALAAYESAKALYSPSAASGTLTAPQSGTIGKVFVTDGQYVEAGTPVAEILSPVTLTLRALLPASEAAFLPLVTDAVVSTHGGDAVRLSTIGGHLASASASGAADIPGYIPVYFNFPNSDPSLVPGMGVEVYLTASPTESLISVPRASIAEQMGESFAFVKTSPHSFAKVPVRLGRSDGER
ncbi:MAG: efflux RND transporter periplasmic adaptor subunit, partial [Duncaniella sp.]|nr:efflux RND transporter periplasmic adaptor subunit [Duncaniella sp.]